MVINNDRHYTIKQKVLRFLLKKKKRINVSNIAIKTFCVVHSVNIMMESGLPAFFNLLRVIRFRPDIYIYSSGAV